MENRQASIVLSITEGRLEISGPEDFVERQIERFSDLIGRLSEAKPAATTEAPPAPSLSGAPLTDHGGDKKVGIEAYPHVFAMAGELLKVTKPITGGTTADKTVRLAQLILLGNALKGRDEVPFGEIRDACSDHGVLDSSNFAATLKGEKELFVCSGSGKKQIAKLTPSGRKKAEGLASELNAAA